MDVTVKTNRFGIIKLLLPFYVVLTFFFVVFWACCIISYEDMKDETFACITLSSLEGVFIVLFLCLKFVNRKTYVFSKDGIAVYRRKNQIKQYDIDTVICLKYNRFRFSYIFYMMNGGMPDGGCWKLYVFLTNGSRITLDVFALKDVEKLKTLYGDLLQITDPTTI